MLIIFGPSIIFLAYCVLLQCAVLFSMSHLAPDSHGRGLLLCLVVVVLLLVSLFCRESGCVGGRPLSWCQYKDTTNGSALQYPREESCAVWIVLAHKLHVYSVLRGCFIFLSQVPRGRVALSSCLFGTALFGGKATGILPGNVWFVCFKP